MIEINEPIEDLVGSAIARHLARDHMVRLIGIVTTVDAVNRLCSVRLGDDTVAVTNVKYDPQLYLVVNDTVIVEVQGARSFFVRNKYTPTGAGAPSVGAAIARIGRQVLTAASASIDFTGIPAEFENLLLEIQARGDVAATNTGLFVRLNGDSAGNYDWQALRGDAAVAAAAEIFLGTSVRVGFCSAATAPANAADVCVVEIPNYARATFQKAMIARSTTKQGTTTGLLTVMMTAGWWRNVAAVNKVTVIPGSGNFIAGSVFTLYGLA